MKKITTIFLALLGGCETAEYHFDLGFSVGNKCASIGAKFQVPDKTGRHFFQTVGDAVDVPCPTENYIFMPGEVFSCINAASKTGQLPTDCRNKPNQGE